jgi:hypothetical protein
MTVRSPRTLVLAALIVAASPAGLRAQPDPAASPAASASPAPEPSPLHIGVPGGPAFTIVGPPGWDRAKGASVWALGTTGHIFIAAGKHLTANNPDTRVAYEMLSGRAHGDAVKDEGSLTICGQPAHRWTELTTLPNGQVLVFRTIVIRLTNGIGYVAYVHPASSDDRPEALTAMLTICDAP